MKTRVWKARVRQVYNSFAELKSYNSVYGIVRRCGYRSVSRLWKDNPMIQGSVYPEDFGLAR